jgi:hypothetical protein
MAELLLLTFRRADDALHGGAEGHLPTNGVAVYAAICVHCDVLELEIPGSPEGSHIDIELCAIESAGYFLNAISTGVHGKR